MITLTLSDSGSFDIPGLVIGFEEAIGRFEAAPGAALSKASAPRDRARMALFEARSLLVLSLVASAGVVLAVAFLPRTTATQASEQTPAGNASEAITAR